MFAVASPVGPAFRNEIRDLIRMISRNNPRWGAPRIHGELLKLGIEITEPTVAKYMVRHRKPPSQTWRTFLDNHVRNMVSVDFFTVPTVRFQILYVFLVLAHDRRRILHFGVTAHPTAEWTAQQVREAFPWDSSPRYLLRDRDKIFGKEFVDQVKAQGIKQVLSAPRSPWQRAYVERLIGSIRRECLDHVIVFGERSLHQYVSAVCGLLPSVAHPSGAGQRRSRTTKSATANRGPRRRTARTGRSAPSLRTPGGVNTRKGICHAWRSARMPHVFIAHTHR